MSLFLEKNSITEMNYGNDFSYILNDSSKFLSTEYKIFKNMEDTCFLKCMKTLHNGKIQLYFLVEEYKTFESIIPTLDAEKLISILESLLASIIEVNDNGFLSCNSINISFDKIYLDANTYKTKLVYLPVADKIYSNNENFENELRHKFVELISGRKELMSTKTEHIMLDLLNDTFSIEDLYNRIHKEKKYNYSESAEYTDKELCLYTSNNAEKKIRLIPIDDSDCEVIEITKDDFTIGKKTSEVDGVISMNRLISRIHCKIVKKDNQYNIIDLMSMNGTYVNNVKLKPNEACILQNGDIIHLANSAFKVEIE